MGFFEEAKHKAERAVGKLEQTVGGAFGNSAMEASGWAHAEHGKAGQDQDEAREQTRTPDDAAPVEEDGPVQRRPVDSAPGGADAGERSASEDAAAVGDPGRDEQRAASDAAPADGEGVASSSGAPSGAPVEPAAPPLDDEELQERREQQREMKNVARRIHEAKQARDTAADTGEPMLRGEPETPPA